MLAAKRFIKRGEEIIERTPLLVPSFSSKCGIPHWTTKELMDATGKLIAGPMLISAYDIHHQQIGQISDYAGPIFVDSGGYEVLVDPVARKTWTQEVQEGVLSTWTAPITATPLVFVSYDHPDFMLMLDQQIDRAHAMAPKRDNIMREYLIKPEPGAKLINIEWLEKNAGALKGFDVIGVPDDEIGTSLKDRAQNVARLRIAMRNAGLDTPIHVFGGLDPFVSALYFVSGADIFDGLSWLKYGFYKGGTFSPKQHRALRFWDKPPSSDTDTDMFRDNYNALNQLQGEMLGFLKKGDYSKFLHHSEDLRRNYDIISEHVEED